MHTKGKAAHDLKETLNLDTCIYLGNDLNDISMFSNALDDNDFIVVAKHEKKEITLMILNYLKEECKIKGIDWEEVRLVVLEEENVNNFLNRMSKILGIINSGKRNNPKDNIRAKYKAKVKPIQGSNKKINKKKKSDGRFH